MLWVSHGPTGNMSPSQVTLSNLIDIPSSLPYSNSVREENLPVHWRTETLLIRQILLVFERQNCWLHFSPARTAEEHLSSNKRSVRLTDKFVNANNAWERIQASNDLVQRWTTNTSAHSISDKYKSPVTFRKRLFVETSNFIVKIKKLKTALWVVFSNSTAIILTVIFY